MIEIYKITNPKGLVYIGQSSDVHKRYLSHRVGSKLDTTLQMSFDLYGFDNHKFELIFECDKKDLLDYESYFIDKYNSISNGLNMQQKHISDFSHLEQNIVEISIPYYVKTMDENPSRDAGRKPKFTVPSKKVLIPICIEDDVNKLAEQYRFINRLQSEALTKCANEALKSKKL